MAAIVRHFLFFCFGIFCSAVALAVDQNQGEALYQKNCAACHGIDGNASAPAFPKLAGQHADYLRKELKDYQAGLRLDPSMQAIAQKLTDQDIENLLAYMQSFQLKNGAVDPNLRAKGEKLFLAGSKTEGIPACASCHSPEGSGNSEAGYPKLAGQNGAYLIQQLQNFHDKKRQNDSNQAMEIIASKLSPEDMQALASYISGLRT